MNLKYVVLDNNIVVLENPFDQKSGSIYLNIDGLGLLDDVDNDTIGFNHALEHIYAMHDRELFNSNAHTTVSSMNFQIHPRESKTTVEDSLDALSNKFGSLSPIEKINVNYLINEIENEFYFRNTTGNIGLMYRYDNKYNDFYLGGRLKQFKDMSIKDTLIEKYKKLIIPENMSMIVSSKLTTKLRKKINDSFFGKLKPKYDIYSGSRIGANFIYNRSNDLSVCFNLPLSINGYVTSFYLNNYITYNISSNLYTMLENNSVNFIYYIYGFDNTNSIHSFLRRLRYSSYDDLVRHSLTNYYNMFNSSEKLFMYYYNLGLPLFKNNYDLLFKFLNGGLATEPYVLSTVNYIKSLDNLYIMGLNNNLICNDTDYNDIFYKKIKSDIDLDNTESEDIQSNEVRKENILYSEYKKISSIFRHKIDIKNKNTRYNIKFKYNPDIISNIAVHAIRLAYRLNYNSCNPSMFEISSNYIEKIESIIYSLNNLQKLDEKDNKKIIIPNKDIKRIINSNKFMFYSYILSDYMIYKNMFKPSKILRYYDELSNEKYTKISPYDFNYDFDNYNNDSLLVKRFNLISKNCEQNETYIPETTLAKIDGKRINVKTEYNFFVLVTDKSVKYDDIMWDLKEKGIIYGLYYRDLPDRNIFYSPLYNVDKLSLDNIKNKTYDLLISKKSKEISIP